MSGTSGPNGSTRRPRVSRSHEAASERSNGARRGAWVARTRLLFDRGFADHAISEEDRSWGPPGGPRNRELFPVSWTTTPCGARRAGYRVALSCWLVLVGGPAGATAVSWRSTVRPRRLPSALRRRPRAKSDSAGRRIVLSPAPSLSVSLRNATTTGFGCLSCLVGFGLAAGCTVPVSVSVQPVSQATRSGRVRLEIRPVLRRTLTVSCGPAGVGRIGSFGGGGLPTGGICAQAPAGGAASANCWTRLLSLSVTVTVPWQSTATAVGWMNWPASVPRAPNASRRSPLGPKRSTRLLPRSATHRSPSPSTAICAGALTLPSLEPVPPNWSSSVPPPS